MIGLVRVTSTRAAQDDDDGRQHEAGEGGERAQGAAKRAPTTPPCCMRCRPGKNWLGKDVEELLLGEPGPLLDQHPARPRHRRRRNRPGPSRRTRRRGREARSAGAAPSRGTCRSSPVDGARGPAARSRRQNSNTASAEDDRARRPLREIESTAAALVAEAAVKQSRALSRDFEPDRAVFPRCRAARRSALRRGAVLQLDQRRRPPCGRSGLRAPDRGLDDDPRQEVDDVRREAAGVREALGRRRRRRGSRRRRRTGS